MLREVERLIANQHGPINLLELAQKLDIHPTAFAGMLETLVRKGRLTAVSSGCVTCESCPVHNACQLPTRRGITLHQNPTMKIERRTRNTSS